MKKTWISPNIETETFETNEYVAACYNLSCNITDLKTFCPLGDNTYYAIYVDKHPDNDLNNIDELIVYFDEFDLTTPNNLACGSFATFNDNSILDYPSENASYIAKQKAYIVPATKSGTDLITDSTMQKEVVYFKTGNGNNYCIAKGTLADYKTSASN